jgi:hypothetical protein
VLCALALLCAVPVVVISVGSGGPAAPAEPVALGTPVGPLELPDPDLPPALLKMAPTAAPPLLPLPDRAEVGLARAAVAAAESAAGPSVELAIAVLDRRTGEIAVGELGAEPFYTASLSKVVVAVDVLDRRRLEGLAVTEADLELLRRTLGPSDDSAMNALWTRFDGAAAPARVSSRLDLSGIIAPDDPSQWGEMRVTAADWTRIWQYVLDEMPAIDRELLVGAMAAAPAVARDGFDQAFGLLDRRVDGPGGPGAVAKQGWMCCFSGSYYLHSAGTVGEDQRFIVALLTRVPRAPGWDAARAELNAIADATVRALI